MFASRAVTLTGRDIDHQLCVSMITIGIVANDRTRVARIVVDDSDVRMLYSSANIVVITAEGIAARRTASRASTPVTPNAYTVKSIAAGCSKFLKRLSTATASVSRTFSSATMSPTTKSESPVVGCPTKCSESIANLGIANIQDDQHGSSNRRPDLRLAQRM